MGLPMSGSHMGAQTGHLLGEISEDEAHFGRLMLSAVAVGVADQPGSGFFALAGQLGKFSPADDEMSFWEAERHRVYEAWKRPIPEGGA